MSAFHPFSDIPAAEADVQIGQSANDPKADIAEPRFRICCAPSRLTTLPLALTHLPTLSDRCVGACRIAAA